MSHTVFLDNIKLQSDVDWSYRRYKAANGRGEISNGAVNLDDYRRWTVVLNLLLDSNQGASLLDVGSGGGQFANAAAKSGAFSRVIAMDRAEQPEMLRLTKKFTFAQKSLKMPLGTKYSSDVIVCMDCLQEFSTTGLGAALDNLRSIVRNRLILTVPFHEPLPLTKGTLQQFDDRKLSSIFPSAKLTYLAKGREIRWALIDEPLQA